MSHNTHCHIHQHFLSSRWSFDSMFIEDVWHNRVRNSLDVINQLKIRMMWCVMRCDCDVMVRCGVVWWYDTIRYIWYDMMWCDVMWCDVIGCKKFFSGSWNIYWNRFKHYRDIHLGKTSAELDYGNCISLHVLIIARYGTYILGIPEYFVHPWSKFSSKNLKIWDG